MPQSTAARSQASHTLPAQLPSSFPAMFAFAARTSPAECTRRRHVSLALGLAIVVALGCNDGARRACDRAACRDRRCPHAVRRLRRRSLAALRHSGGVDTRRDAGGKLRRRARHLAEGRDGPDADHARDVGRLASALRSRRRSLRRARQHHRRRRLSARAARPLRRSRLPRGLQCRSRALGRSSRDRPAAACGDARLPRPPRANRRRKCNRRHGHSRRRGAVLDRGVAVSVARRSSHPSDTHRCIRCRNRRGRRPIVRRRIGPASRRSPTGCSSPCRPGSGRNERARS